MEIEGKVANPGLSFFLPDREKFLPFGRVHLRIVEAVEIEVRAACTCERGRPS